MDNRSNRFSRVLFCVAVCALIFADLLVVRDFSFLRDNIWSGRFFVNFLLSSLGLASLLYLIRIGFVRGWLRLVFFVLFVCVPLFLQVNYFAVYREFIGPFGFSFFIRNPQLTLTYFNEHVIVSRSLIAVGFILFVYFLLNLSSQFAPGIRSSRRRTVLASLCVAFYAGVVSVCTFAWYGVHEFQHSSMAFASSFVEFASRKSGVFQVKKPKLAKRASTANLPSIVWIVGESAVRNQMSLYGYQRDTTPYLRRLKERGELVAFENAISVGNKTMLSVPYMLFGLEGPDKGGRIYRSSSIFDYAKSTGYTTALISAQEMRWYNLDKLLVDENVDVYKAGPRFNPEVTISKGADDETVIDVGILPFLRSATEPFILVYQMDGSHYPYSTHSPLKFKRFLPEGETNSLNAYDNTLVYTDYVLSKLIAEVRKSHPNTWIFYTSDHGQNLGDKKYNSDYSLDVIHNPLFVLPPVSSNEIVKLKANIAAPVSQADVFSTALELMDLSCNNRCDGVSLLGNISASRVRTSSTFMPTFESDPTAVLVTPDLKTIAIDFVRGTASFDKDNVVDIDELEPELKMKLLR